MSFVGVNIGALRVKVVALRGDNLVSRVASHQGRPLEVLKTLLSEADFADADYFGVSGQLGHISEVAAIQRALPEVSGDFDAIASLGGESFLVYLLANGKIAHVLSHNQCAAGSGEFFMQQIGRMGLGIEEAIRRSFGGKVVPLASRCSVHCKSDITHKLNRNEASVEDILHTLHDSMANKVASLLEKGQRPLGRVLVIGGVAQNAAMVAALREKRPDTEFVVLPESPVFEAWGCALLTRDDPRYTAPQLSGQPRLSSLPPLAGCASRVQVIPAPQLVVQASAFPSASGGLPPSPGLRRTGKAGLPTPPASDKWFVLGVDAGSTTTKAVLLDPASHELVASHYTRTRSDPVTATRECLRAMAAQAGHHRIGLVATTGSARELVGAYLGTAHVYNEIAAQAAGAAHFDAEVDTIFEIGGQDSKYIYLRNGVPIHYEMNNACSAGTGSFLEESAKGDLGIPVSEIAAIALAAPAPVHFKATCAAFINSDIRIAQQQGQSRENIVAGLVHSIAANYLTRVKGPRPVGRKVFLQGGVALNHAVGNAFACRLGRPVVIPPHPELLGALGVALLALQRNERLSAAAEPPQGTTDLLSLAAPAIKSVGQFTCRACRMYCSIDRFEVADRRFPFGGRCSLFEHVWKRANRTPPAPDLVEQRADMIFGTSESGSSRRKEAHFSIEANQSLLTSAATVCSRIGIPKALTTYSLHPLYSTFFTRLGLEVVLSGIDPQGDLKAHSGFCFPVQMAHGAVLDLARQRVDLVFLPHVLRMPQPNPCHDSYLCPITQAGPYVLAKAFPAVRFLSPLLDFTHGYADSLVLVEMAMRELGVSRELAQRAWAAAVAAQTEAERRLHDLGQQALEQVLARGEPAILLAGHSYNAFAPEASQSVGKKLSSMGVTAIPADCLLPVSQGLTAWHFSNQILNATALAKRHPNLFLLCISNFSCTVDAFTHALVSSEMGAKPYLILEIDAHTADAGVQTRLEAFLDIIRNYQALPPGDGPSFTPCRLGADGRLIRANGERVPLSDPRVKLHFPNFSPYHSQALALTARWLGLNYGDVMSLDRSQLDLGLHYTSGRECLPLPLCVGQMLQIHEQRQPGEIVGLYMLRSGAPCVADAYRGYLERFIVEQRLPDLFLLNPGKENNFCGFDEATLAKHISPALFVADILVEIAQVLRVVGTGGSTQQLAQAWEQFAAAASSLERFQAALPEFIEQLAAIPRQRDPLTCPRVVVTGDFFTRFSPFFMEGVHERYAAQGIILKPADLNDLLLYISYNSVAQTAGAWGLKPGGLALAKACTRAFQTDGKKYLQHWLAYQADRRLEEYYRGMFRKTGLLLASPKDVSASFDTASEHVSPTIFGEVIPTLGQGLKAESEGYDGIIVIGPFNCLPFRIAEAILKPLSVQHGMPVLTYESDGYAVSPAILRQVDVHIQQVLEHAAKIPAVPLDATERLTKYFRDKVEKWR